MISAASAGLPGTGGATAEAVPLLLIVLGLLALGMVMLISVRNRLAARQAERKDPAERILEIKKAAAARETVEAARAQLLDLAQELASKIDAKAARLEALLDRAEDERARLQGLLTGAKGAIADAKEREPKAVTATRKSAFTDDPLLDRVYALSDDGRSSAEIAREIDEHVGKIELILALREQRTKRGAAAPRP